MRMFYYNFHERGIWSWMVLFWGLLHLQEHHEEIFCICRRYLSSPCAVHRIFIISMSAGLTACLCYCSLKTAWDSRAEQSAVVDQRKVYLRSQHPFCQRAFKFIFHIVLLQCHLPPSTIITYSLSRKAATKVNVFFFFLNYRYSLGKILSFHRNWRWRQ